MRSRWLFRRSRFWVVGLVAILAVGYGVGAQVVENLVPIPLVSSIDDAWVDGELGTEVLDASFTRLLFAGEECIGFRGGLFAKRTEQVLYMALVVELDRDLRDVEAFAALDASGDGQLYNRGDDIWIVQVDASQGLPLQEGVDYAYPALYSYVQDVTLGGTEDVAAAATLSDRVLVAEFLRPLDSGDRLGMDGDLSSGETIYVGVGFTGTGSAIEAIWEGWIQWPDEEPDLRQPGMGFDDITIDAPPPFPPIQYEPPLEQPEVDPGICEAWEREEHAYLAEHYPLEVIVTRGKNSKGGYETTFTDITLRVIHFKDRERGPCGLEEGHEGPHQPWTWSAWREDGIQVDVITTTTTIGGWPEGMSTGYFERWLVPAFYRALQSEGFGHLKWRGPFCHEWYEEELEKKL